MFLLHSHSKHLSSLIYKKFSVEKFDSGEVVFCIFFKMLEVLPNFETITL